MNNVAIWEEIANRYQNGEGSQELSVEFSISRRQIDKRLRQWNIPTNKQQYGLKFNLTQEELNDAIVRYRNGEDKESIAACMHVNYDRLCDLFRVENIENRRLDFELNHNAFSIITSESAYWIGFLAADGNVAKEHNYISVKLQTSDIGHLRKLAKFVNSKNKIAAQITNTKFIAGHQVKANALFTHSLRFTSGQMIKDLANHNVVPNKTDICKPSESFKFNRDYWRGCIDGDGWVGYSSKYNRHDIGFCGTYDMVQGFLEYVQTFAITNAKPSKDGSIYKIRFQHSLARQIITHLYQDATIYLDRKYEIAKGVLNAS